MTGLLVLLGVAFSVTAASESPAAKGRKVFERHKSAVVTVQLVIKQQFSMGGQGSRESEEKTEVTGTMIDPSGLTVTALSGIDPSRIYRDMMAARGMDGADFKMESEVTSAKILLEDGTELDARVLLRDSDLDLAFVRPTAPPESPLPYVDLTDDAEPALLDDLVALNRLGKVARRAYAAIFECVEAIVTKPRTFYIRRQHARERVGHHRAGRGRARGREPGAAVRRSRGAMMADGNKPTA